MVKETDARPRENGIRDAAAGLKRPTPRSRRSGSATLKEFFENE
jgi:hypothetical protein